MRTLPTLLATLALATFTIAIATQAEARRGSSGGSTYEALHLVQPLKDDGQDRSLSLCHLVETHAVLFIPVWTTMQGYALAENQCQTDRYRLLSPSDFAYLQDKGAIAATLPTAPRLNATLSMRNWFVAGGAAALLGLALLTSLRKALGSRNRRHLRTSKLGKISPLAHQTLDAMCHLAKADGHVDRAEIALIAGIAERLTGQPISETSVREMIDSASGSRVDFSRFRKGLSAGDGRIVMQGVMMTAAADGTFEHQELGFMMSLANALGISKPEFELLLRDAAQPA